MRQEAIEGLMKFPIPISPLPPHLEISSELTEDEQPKVYMKEIQVKLPKKEERGASFHEKSAKNSKANKKVTRRDEMKKKYGKPITRRGKK
jgi:ATP-dependent RNA helicase RhlE